MAARAFFVLLLLATTALAQGTLEVIPLKHRTAEQVIPVLRPLLEPGGALTGQYSQLIVRTSPENLAQLRAALEAIDTPIRKLLISVRFDDVSASSRLGSGVRIQNREEQVDQRIQVLEGGQAYISAGQSRVYADAATGFAVVPRLAGSRVTLEILAQQESFARGGAIQSHSASTTVSGRLGEWFELGGRAGSVSREQSGVLSQRETRSSAARSVWVKVDEVPN
jgi:type II secretory pathway component GspD/PulD (secretin)